MSIIDLQSLGLDDEFSITRRSKTRSKKPMFSMVGEVAKNHRQISGVPLLDLMLEFNRDQQRFFKLLLEHRNVETNQCSLRDMEITPTDKVKISKAYTSLKALGLVKRVGVANYMINPKALIPPMTYEETQKHWDSLV